MSRPLRDKRVCATVLLSRCHIISTTTSPLTKFDIYTNFAESQLLIHCATFDKYFRQWGLLEYSRQVRLANYISRLSIYMMNLLKKIAAAVLLLSFVVFVAFFGRLPTLRYVLNINVSEASLSSFQKDTNWFTQPPHMQYTASQPLEARCCSHRREVGSCFSSSGKVLGK